MKRNAFHDFCNTHNLEVCDAGRDWRDAGYHGAYLCAVIADEQDYACIKPLLEREEAYLASAERKNGQAWFKHSGQGLIYSTKAGEVAAEMREQFCRFLDTKSDASYYSAECIAARDKALAEMPALPGETASEHFQRVSEESPDGWLAPLYVTEEGTWGCSASDLILSSKDHREGIWSYRYDNWEQRVILVLKDDDTDQAEEE